MLMSRLGNLEYPIMFEASKEALDHRHYPSRPIEKISKVLNHSATAVTMRYLGITNQEVLDTYDEYEL